MSALKILKIDPSQEKELVHASKTVLTESGSHKADYIEKIWAWNYKELPSKRCDVIAAVEHGKILGYVHVVYVDAQVNNEKCLAAIIQDGGVLAEARGRGLWRKITNYTVDVIEKSEATLIYAYPNVKAIHTWRKYNDFEKVFDYKAYILPLNGAAIIKSKINIPIISNIIGASFQALNNLRLSPKDRGNIKIIEDSIDHTTAALFENYANRFKIHVTRNKAFLNWRYFDKPVGKHFALSYVEQEKVLACGIFKIDTMLGVDSFILMDFAYEKDQEDKMGKIFRHLKDITAQITSKIIGLIFCAFWNTDFLAEKSYGFIKVPDKINPRIMPFLTKNIRDTTSLFDQNNWHVTLGEWDVL